MSDGSSELKKSVLARRNKSLQFLTSLLHETPRLVHEGTTDVFSTLLEFSLSPTHLTVKSAI